MSALPAGPRSSLAVLFDNRRAAPMLEVEEFLHKIIQEIRVRAAEKKGTHATPINGYY